MRPPALELTKVYDLTVGKQGDGVIGRGSKNGGSMTLATDSMVHSSVRKLVEVAEEIISYLIQGYKEASSAQVKVRDSRFMKEPEVKVVLVEHLPHFTTVCGNKCF